MSPSPPRWIALLVLLLSGGGLRADLVTAERLYGEQRYAEAQPEFEAALATDPTNRSALLHLGKLAAKRRDRAEAVRYLKQAVELLPEDAELQFEYGAACSFYADSLGTTLRAAIEARRGRIAMERAVELEPDNFMFRQGLIEFYTTAPRIVGGSMPKAYEQADAIAARDSDQGAFATANLKIVERDYRAALDILAGVLRNEPDNYYALFQFGRTSATSGLDLDAGRAALRRCLELPAPDKGAPPASVWWQVSLIESRQGNLAAARQALVQAQALAPNDSRIATALAEMPAGS